MKKFQEFIKVVLHSKTQQESIIRSKRGKRVEESPTSSTSPATRRERKKTRSSETDNRQARVSLFTSFTPTASTPEAPTMRRILPKPTEQEPESSKGGYWKGKEATSLDWSGSPKGKIEKCRNTG